MDIQLHEGRDINAAFISIGFSLDLTNQADKGIFELYEKASEMDKNNALKLFLLSCIVQMELSKLETQKPKPKIFKA
jgi:hypothetical protein